MHTLAAVFWSTAVLIAVSVNAKVVSDQAVEANPHHKVSAPPMMEKEDTQSLLLLKKNEKDDHNKILIQDNNINIPSSLAPFDGVVTCSLFDGYPSICSNLTGCAYCCASGECLELSSSHDGNGQEDESSSAASTTGRGGDIALVQVPTAAPASSKKSEAPPKSVPERIWWGAYSKNFKHNKTCPTPAVLPEGSLNCDVACFNATLDLKDSHAELCTDCLTRPWCLYCGGSAPMCLHTTSAICPQTMQKNCADHGSVPRNQSFVDKVIPYLVLVCIVVGLLVIILPIGRFIYVKIQQKLEQRRDIRRREEFRAEQRRREEEERQQRQGTSAASSTNPTTGSDGVADAGREEENAGASPAPLNSHSSNDVSRDAAEDVEEDDQAIERSSETGTTISNSRELSERQPLLSATTASSSAALAPSPSVIKKDEAAVLPVSAPSISSMADEETCQLCLDARATIVNFPCYHCYCCEDCSSKLRPSGNRRDGFYISCPFCRQRVRAMVNIEPLPEIIKNSLRKRGNTSGCGSAGAASSSAK